MSFYSLLNKRCSWKRRISTGANSFGEVIFTEQMIGSDVRCARQVGDGNNDRQFINNLQTAPKNVKLVTYYLMPSEDIQENDIIIFQASEQGIVRDVKDDGGRNHHKSVLVEEVQSVGETDVTDA